MGLNKVILQNWNWLMGGRGLPNLLLCTQHLRSFEGKNIFVSQVFSGCASGYITFNASGCWETVCGTETSSRISVSMFFTFFSLIGVLLDWLCSLAIYFSSCLRYGEQDYVVGLAQFHPSRFLQALDILMELNCWIFYTLLLPNFLAFWLKF